jgi:hypothetical protein
MTTTPHINITQLIESLLNDRHDDTQPTIPDALTDLSHVTDGLRTLSKNGRALHSDEGYSIGTMLGQLLQAYIPTDPTDNDYKAAILGLTLFIARLMRAVPEIATDLSLEEFLIEPTDQDSLIALGQTLSAIPLITTPEGQLRPNFAQLPIFHQPLTITQESLDGFGARRIAPYENIELPMNANILSFVELEDFPQAPEEWTTDPLEGFDEFFDAYFDDTDNTDDL